MKRIIIISLFFLICGFSFSQSLEELDSLLKILPSDKEDTNKVRHLVFISEDYCLIDYQKSLDYANQALNLSEKINYDRGIASSSFRISHAYYSMGNIQKAMDYKKKELKKWREMNFQIGICSSLGELGVFYSDMGNNVKAMEYYIASLRLAEKTGVRSQIKTNLCNIASLHYTLGDNKLALLYYNKSLKLSEQDGDKMMVANNYSNIANIYIDNGDFLKALDYSFLAGEIYDSLNDRGHYAAILINIGCIYQIQSDSAGKSDNFELRKEKSAKALHYFIKALEITDEIGSEYYKMNVLGNIGAIYINEKKFSEAEKYLQQAIDLSIKLNSPVDIMENYRRFTKLYKDSGQPQEALDYYEKYTSIKDSVYSKENQTMISELQIQYDTEKKDAENIALAKQNETQELLIKKNNYILISLIIILLFIIIGAMILYNQIRLKSKQQAVMFNQKLLRMQMNPHFIFNSLASIESFIYENQPKEAGEYLSKFSRLIRLILENSSSEYITLEKEIETLSFYLKLEKLRLNDNLDYKIVTDQTLQPDKVFLPPMLTQPFIENAIEHGFRGGNKPGTIFISFMKKEDNLMILIKDNGIGITVAEMQKEKLMHHKSLAMQITWERLRILNKSKRKKMYFEVKDIISEDNLIQGTHIEFSIPLQDYDHMI